MLDRTGTERLKHHARWETVCVLERGSVMHECYLYRLSVVQIKKENATFKHLDLESGTASLTKERRALRGSGAGVLTDLMFFLVCICLFALAPVLLL